MCKNHELHSEFMVFFNNWKLWDYRIKMFDKSEEKRV